MATWVVLSTSKFKAIVDKAQLISTTFSLEEGGVSYLKEEKLRYVSEVTFLRSWRACDRQEWKLPASLLLGYSFLPLAWVQKG